MNINFRKIYMIVYKENFFETEILAHFEHLTLCLFTKYNEFTKYNDFVVVISVLAKRLTNFDPPKQKLNNLTDINEGMSTIEEMVGGKLADKLVNELGAIFGKPLKPKTKLIQPENGGEAFEVEEIKLRTGESFIMSNLLNSFMGK